ncbi:MAG: alpha/beta fold hydrolase, partial [Gemmatimonadota bacterium]|nr:alpha/beta fold hydrolase [Gemmatimonadota bacterium]
MRSEKLQFEGALGDELVGRLETPTGGDPVAYALFAHCFTCSKDLKAAVNVSRALAAERIAVFRFDFTGLGESAGDFADTNFSSNVDDLVAAADFLAGEYEAPEVLVGHSLGGAAVLQAASRVPSSRAVATIGAPAEPGHVVDNFEEKIDEILERDEAEVTLAGRSFTIRRQFLEDLEETRMAETVRELDRALMLFHSPVDNTVGVDNAARLYEWAKHPKSFVSLDWADHLLLEPRDSRFVGTMLAAWARRYLEGVDLEEETGRRDSWNVEEDEVAVRIGRERFRTEIMAGGHPLVADEPEDVGGTDQGPTPYDLLSASLGTCTAMTLRMYAD